MKFRQKPTLIFLFASCIFMMLTLAWFTVSLPFVYAAQQKVQLNKAGGQLPVSQNEEETDNPFATTTEEKTSSSSSMSEEYLHDTHSSEEYPDVLSTDYKVRQVSTYIAFYGELISPPPDAS